MSFTVKRLLAKIIPNKAVGLYVGENAVTACLVAGTPLGAIELACRTETYEPEQLDKILPQLLQAVLGRGKSRGYPVVLGLPAGRVFFSSRPVRSDSDDVSPQVLLHEALQSSNLSVDDMVVELLRTQPGKRKVVSLVACRKKYLGSLLHTMQTSGVRPPRAEPTLCALLRTGASRHKAPRRTRAVVRLFLGGNLGMGIVAVGNSPLIWRFFDLSPGTEGKCLCAAVRTLQTLMKPCGVDAPLEMVLIHGSPRQPVDGKKFSADLGLPVVWCEGPGLEDSNIAFGLALGGLNQTAEGLDLARSLKPAPSLREMFPWKELILQILVLAGMAVYLHDRSAALHEKFVKVQGENLRHPWAASIAVADLDKEKKDLEAKVDAFRSFLGTRILWSKYTHDISGRLPSNIWLNSMQGTFEMEATGKSASLLAVRKSFVLRASAPLRGDGAMPPEIDAFLGSLRQHPLLQRDFPNIEMTDIKSTRAESAKATASFSVICLPKIEPKAARTAPAGKAASTGK